MAFYNQTLSAVTAGRAKMQAAGLPIRRPNDYFCENVKSDAHMTKVTYTLNQDSSLVHRTLFSLQSSEHVFVLFCRSRTGC